MKLRILSWNISYGYGMGSEGVGYHTRIRTHFEDTLNAMSEFLKHVQIDVALLQEVDFHSRRSHFIEELDWLARRSGLLHRQSFVTWDAPYVPYPGLNPKNHFGRIVSGGGILSRYPLEPLHCELLPKPRENSRLYNWFYLSRFLQAVSVQTPVGDLKVCNLHLEAFSAKNREMQLQRLQDRLTENDWSLAGGDFNGEFELREGMSPDWRAYPAPEPTFPSLRPDQKLDGFIVKSGDFSQVTIETLNTGTLSDHFPVLLEVNLSKPDQV